jgi:NAD(P)-dependent dehydrogenase (short-subunit alcohol dehydrogenase family)
MTKALAREVYKENIRVHAVSPGGVYTDMVKITRPDLTPDGMIMPSDVADIVNFLIKHRTNAVIDEIELHRATKQPF